MVSFGLLLAALLSACGAESRPMAGRETHWLTLCEDDGECGEGDSCVCGLCSAVCEASEDCPGELECQSAGSELYEHSCATTAPSTPGLCAPSCASEDECADGQLCVDTVCVPASVLAGTGDSQTTGLSELQECASDGDCSTGACLCGVCSLECADRVAALREQRDPCEGGPEGSTCVPATLSPVPTQLCGEPAAIDLCLPPTCEFDTDCQDGLCVDERCGQRDLLEPIDATRGTIRYWWEMTLLYFDEQGVWLAPCTSSPNAVPGAATLEGCHPDAAAGISSWSPAGSSGAVWSRGDSSLPSLPDAMFHTTLVAHAAEASAAWEIDDASALSYADTLPEAAPPGSVLVFRDTETDVFLALEIDRVWYAGDLFGGPLDEGYADVTWYLQADGSGDFSGFEATANTP